MSIDKYLRFYLSYEEKLGLAANMNKLIDTQIAWASANSDRRQNQQKTSIQSTFTFVWKLHMFMEFSISFSIILIIPITHY